MCRRSCPYNALLRHLGMNTTWRRLDGRKPPPGSNLMGVGYLHKSARRTLPFLERPFPSWLETASFFGVQRAYLPIRKGMVIEPQVSHPAIEVVACAKTYPQRPFV